MSHRDVVPVVYARNAAGTEATARFWLKVFPKKFRSRDLNLDDRFLTKVANELDPGGTRHTRGALHPREQRVAQEEQPGTRRPAIEDRA